MADVQRTGGDPDSDVMHGLFIGCVWLHTKEIPYTYLWKAFPSILTTIQQFCKHGSSTSNCFTYSNLLFAMLPWKVYVRRGFGQE